MAAGPHQPDAGRDPAPGARQHGRREVRPYYAPGPCFPQQQGEAAAGARPNVQHVAPRANVLPEQGPGLREGRVAKQPVAEWDDQVVEGRDQVIRGPSAHAGGLPRAMAASRGYSSHPLARPNRSPVDSRSSQVLSRQPASCVSPSSAIGAMSSAYSG